MFCHSFSIQSEGDQNFTLTVAEKMNEGQRGRNDETVQPSLLDRYLCNIKHTNRGRETTI